MRNLVGSILVLAALALQAGCAAEKAPAKAPTAPHMSVAMDDETSRALLGEDLAGGDAVGTTALTSAIFIVPAKPTAREATPQAGPLPEETVDDEVATARTWGVDPVEVEGIPTRRE